MTARLVDRRHLMRLAAGTGLAAAWPGSGRAQQARGWFKLGSDNPADYVLDWQAGDAQVTIRHKAWAKSKARVMVLYSRPSTAYDTAIGTLLDAFHERRFPITAVAHNYHGDEGHGVIAMQHAINDGFDLIYTMGSDTTDFAWPRFRDARVPIVSVCSKDPVVLGQQSDYQKGSGTAYAFTSLDMPVAAQFAYLKELKPGLKNLSILADIKNVSAMTVQLRPMAAFARGKGTAVHELIVQRRSQAAAELAQMIPAAITDMRRTDPDLRNSVFWVTGSTAVFEEIETINAHAGRVPVLSVVPDVVQPGRDSAVVSIGVGFDSNAYIAAAYGLAILDKGVKPGSLPVGIVSPPDIAINFLRAREIGLKIPFGFVETASTIYGPDGRVLREKGRPNHPA